MRQRRGGKRERLLFHHSSVKAIDDRTIMAAPAGRGIWIAPPQGNWLSCMEGLPEGLHVNRIQLGRDRAFACTDAGLYDWTGTRWTPTDMPLTCYQVREVGELLFAATAQGLWCRTENGWKSTASPHQAVYDFLYAPQYIFLAMDGGIAMYDRLTFTWEQFPMGTAVTGLGVFRSRLLGVTERGELLQGDRKGGFEKIRLPGLFVFRAASAAGSVYLCTERGLYRLSELRGQTAAISVSMGLPVTDLDERGGRLYMATLSEGVQTIELRGPNA
ncbi:hypothetical protein J19TS2_07750 [Cohnella xylanilytica]|uniref:Uncharacterized protein n=1 Tax=Cohnella xylanilytica TaxID=557555 RepID=A0A841U4U3_9BACL|nr:hypothetical protein [Cohnella xylanilytica]MBB6694809.1 hypothetical protein [Cohnella xylanilytica]GIO11220.1 hypothetical protein J19TS2_07750 [Cohnella xylanilytica]